MTFITDWDIVTDVFFPSRYLFWYDTNPLVENGRGLFKRMDGVGENVRTIASFDYSIRKLVVDSFARHLYWFNRATKAICRMDYDGYNQKAVVHTGVSIFVCFCTKIILIREVGRVYEYTLCLQDNVLTFAFFENSVYWSADNFIPIKKCRTYGPHPRKCEIIKLHVHSVRHLAILQKNGQRLGKYSKCQLLWLRIAVVVNRN